MLLILLLIVKCHSYLSYFQQNITESLHSGKVTNTYTIYLSKNSLNDLIEIVKPFMREGGGSSPGQVNPDPTAMCFFLRSKLRILEEKNKS